MKSDIQNRAYCNKIKQETATSNRINKEEPFQTIKSNSDKKRQQHNKTQQK